MRKSHLLLPLLFAAVALLPLTLVSIPPLTDYPNHLARMFVLAHWHEMPALQANYALNWAILPNLAMDLVVPPLSRIMPLELAGRVFLALCLGVLAGGTAVLHRVLHGRWSHWPLLAMPLLYSQGLTVGLVNFLFAAGLFLLAMAGWLVTEHWPSWRRLILFGATAVVLFFAHLFAVAMWGVAVGSLELTTRRPWRQRLERLAMIGLCLLPAVLLWLAKPSGPPDSSIAYDFSIYKMRVIMSGLMFRLDPVDAVGLAGLVTLCLLAWRRAAFDRRMTAPLVILFGVALLVPRRAMGGFLLDMRLPLVLPFLLVAAGDWGSMAPARRRLMVGLALALLSLRVEEAITLWRPIDRDYSEFRQAAKLLPPGSHLMQVLDGFPGEGGYDHMAELAVLERCAFVPHMAKLPDQQPILPSAATAAIDGGTAAALPLADLSLEADPVHAEEVLARPRIGWQRPWFAHWPERYDHLLLVHDRPQPNPLPALLEPIAHGAAFDLYHIKGRNPPPPARCGEASP